MRDSSHEETRKWTNTFANRSGGGSSGLVEAGLLERHTRNELDNLLKAHQRMLRSLGLRELWNIG